MEMRMLVTLATGMLLGIVTIAPAQMWSNQPKTITYTNKATGEKIGTAIISKRGNETFIVLRDKHDVHYATIINEPDGSRKWVDPSGNPIDPKTTLLPLE
jgi:hypothetical protein